MYWAEKNVPVAGLTDAVSKLTAAGKNVLIMDDNPGFSFDAFECKYQQGLLLPKKCSESSATFNSKYTQYIDKLAAAASSSTKAHLVNVAQLFCTTNECSMRRGDDVLYRDVNHLNLIGSRFEIGEILKTDPAARAALTSH